MRSTAVQFLTRSSGAWRSFFVVCLLFVQVFGIAMCHGQSGQDRLHVYTVYGMAECVSGQLDLPQESESQMACSIDLSDTNAPETTIRSSQAATGMLLSIVAEPVFPLQAAIIHEQERQHFEYNRDVPLPEDPFIGIPKQPPRFA